jgi:carbon storage regulator
MLVLSRRIGQKIVFPSMGVTVQVLSIQGSVVRIGIKAPAEVTVVRHEIADRVSNVSPERSQNRSQTGDSISNRVPNREVPVQ